MIRLRGIPSFGRTRRIMRWLHSNLPPLNFITLHYAYFIGACLIGAVIFWGSSTPARSVSFTDSLFLVVSAMTLAGLNTVNLSQLNTFQQFLMFFFIIIGSAIFVSAFVVHIRRKAFERKFNSVISERTRRGRSRTGSIRLSLSRSRHRDERPPDPISSGASAAHHDSEAVSNMAVDQTLESAGPNSDEIQQSVATSTALDHLTSEKVQSDDPNAVLHTENEAPLASGDEDTSPRTSEAAAQSKGGASPIRPLHVDTDHITFHPSTVFRLPSPGSALPHRHSRFLSMQGVGARSTSSLHQVTELGQPLARTATLSSAAPSNTLTERTQSYFPFTGAVGRNSQFHHLTHEEREQLGGVEYKAICFLSVVVPLYFVLWQLLGAVGIGAYVWNNRASTARENGLNPFWVGAFNAISAFNNSGMSLLDANMVAFQTSIYMLLTMGLLILAGNTCYPIFLRLLIWTMKGLMPDSSDWWKDHKNTLQFLLDHPRRCYTNLFPSEHTWWLASCVFVLNGVDWAGFEILNIGNPEIQKLPTNIKVIDGLFQAFAVRSGGFYVVPIPTVRISLQVLYVIMMYISVYPIVISIRNSNVYEERSLGIYADDPGYNPSNPSNDPDGPGKGFRMFASGLKRQLTGTTTNEQSTKRYFLRQQLQAQLTHDLWWLCLAIFLIMIVEGNQFQNDPTTYSVFNVIFETVSAYGCVGVSVGVPYDAYSFSGALHTLSKLILCAVMLRGRHRGLPVAIDKAVLLPGEKTHRAEEEDAQIRLERTMSRGSLA